MGWNNSRQLHITRLCLEGDSVMKKESPYEQVYAGVEKPFIPRAPDAEATAYLYRSGELMSYYWDWEILYCVEEIFDCMSSGIPHKHAVNRIIARRYRNNRRMMQDD